MCHFIAAWFKRCSHTRDIKKLCQAQLYDAQDTTAGAASNKDTANQKRKEETRSKCTLNLNVGPSEINSRNLCLSCRNVEKEYGDPNGEVYAVIGGYEYRIL
jgi:hypothetical protein